MSRFRRGCTLLSSFAALFFATSKRWAEYRQLGDEAARHRPALAGYSGEVLGQMLTITAGGALLSYALYTIESARVPTDGSMALTLPFVAFGLFRYLLLLNGERRTEAPDRILFTDPPVAGGCRGVCGDGAGRAGGGGVAVRSERSAVSGQRSAVSGQRSASIFD